MVGFIYWPVHKPPCNSKHPPCAEPFFCHSLSGLLNSAQGPAISFRDIPTLLIHPWPEKQFKKGMGQTHGMIYEQAGGGQHLLQHQLGHACKRWISLLCFHTHRGSQE